MVVEPVETTMLFYLKLGYNLPFNHLLNNPAAIVGNYDY